LLEPVFAAFKVFSFNRQPWTWISTTFLHKINAFL